MVVQPPGYAIPLLSQSLVFRVIFYLLHSEEQSNALYYCSINSPLIRLTGMGVVRAERRSVVLDRSSDTQDATWHLPRPHQAHRNLL